MNYRNVIIEKIACVLPPEVVTSEALEQRLKALYDRLHLPFGRLELMTGIRERRFWPKGTRPSQASAEAGRKAMEQAGVAPSSIDCLLHCSVSRDYVEPATSTAVHRLLQLPSRAINLDLSNACLGVLSGMVMMGNMIELGQIERGLIVAGESARPLVETTINRLNRDPELTRRSVKPWFASLTIGSGAAAVVMARDDVARGGARLLGGTHLCNTAFNHLCQGSGDTGMDSASNPIMATDSEELLVQGVKVAQENWEYAKQELQWTNETPDVVCTHQVGRIHRQKLYEALGLDMSRDFSTVERMGNCGSVALPATVALAAEEGALKPGQRLAMLGIGSGINCLMLGAEWG